MMALADGDRNACNADEANVCNGSKADLSRWRLKWMESWRRRPSWRARAG